MKFIIERAQLIGPLQQVTSPFSNRQSLPILNNVLLEVMKNCLLLIGTDLEIEIIARITLNEIHEPGATTVSARKFFDICRHFPENAIIIVTFSNHRMIVRSGRSCYMLATLPAANFPHLEDWTIKIEFTLLPAILKQLIESTQFSMAHQDVRYYLNGILLEIKSKTLSAVATDGHRLAICTIPIGKTLSSSHSIILPRKGVMGLMRMLDSVDKPITLQIGNNNIRAIIGNYIFTSKLIDGYFPDYQRILLKNSNKILQAKRDSLKQAFSRVSILSNEKFRGVRLYLSTDQLKITVNTLEQEEAEEILDVHYQGEVMEISFNVRYIIDVLNVLKCEKVKFLLTDGSSSMQIEDSMNSASSYIIMPMRI
ncbi:DNA polymerase III subunit beta [Candidatus Curculioniphilus buchneri]|uniref:DNA polymerase III subunit beta n=1 Tax=Candidatus Curculioniphilus buchneri TaxID=690594 RepID=UPI00376EB3FE